MAVPSDLVTHYSTKAFQTRLAALSFVGAVLGADVIWKSKEIQSDILGIGLLLVVGSLAELNRRYTYSYLCACIAAARSETPQQMWLDFRKMNEAPWSEKALVSSPRGSREKTSRRQALASRFLLSWGTYLPGIAAGLYLVWSRVQIQELLTVRVLRLVGATALAGGLLAWWGAQAVRTYNPELLLPKTPHAEAER